ncbi:MAG: enoyl-CoA hydratase/isomerase family protein [Xanthobacteraceae bacterium]|nr:MAG: enoyl-CoA hydratase/isomerase family protein [Xanthobacteraceae bacterium]
MIKIERDGPVVVATMSRPPVNALNKEMVERFHALLDQITSDDSVTVLHLRSDQKIFSAGADLALMHSCFSTPTGPDEMIAVVREMQELFFRIEAAPVVSVAELTGTAMGGGMELALACDVRVAAIESKLGLPESRLGLLPGAGGTQRLAQLCGRGAANRLILGAEIIDGAEAERIGLVEWAKPRSKLAEWTARVVQRFAAIPRAAIAANKRCIAASGDFSRGGYAQEISLTRALYDHPETRRRVSEFLVKA